MYKKIIFLLILIFPLSTLASLDENWKRDAIKATKEVPVKYAQYINEAMWEYHVSKSLITAIIIVESLGNPEAVSKSGAKCLMQTKDFIGEEVGMPGNSCEPRESIMRGTAYLARIRNVYEYDWPEGMAIAYNVGWNRAKNMSDDEILDHSYVQKMYFVLKHLD